MCCPGIPVIMAATVAWPSFSFLATPWSRPQVGGRRCQDARSEEQPCVVLMDSLGFHRGNKIWSCLRR